MLHVPLTKSNVFSAPCNVIKLYASSVSCKQLQALQNRSCPSDTFNVSAVAMTRDMAMPAPIEAAACHWVASLPDLLSMINSLESVKMLAVDVEHHHLHSYLGFVCLLQLSTGKPVWPACAFVFPHNELNLFAAPRLAEGGCRHALSWPACA